MFKALAIAATSTALLGSADTARAQQWGRGPTPRDGACFYQDADFEGDYFCARAGDDFSSIPGGLNDEISSVRLFGRVEVTVYRDRKFHGSSRRLTRNVRNLRDEGWNDTVSSIRVDEARNGSGYGGYRPPYGQYDNPDRIVRRAYQDILDREPDAAGMRLYRSRIIDDGWTEAQVRDALRKSPEYREKNTITWAKAQEIVRNAYLNVLKREPDSGSRGYVEKVYSKKWTQQDVERELRKSPEYRQR